MNDLELVIDCQSGKLDSFGELYDRYIDKIYKFIYLKTSQKQTAEDITSEVFYKALNSIASFKSDKKDTSFQSWLYTIANNKVIDYYRTQKAESDIEECYNLGDYIDFGNQLDIKDKLADIQKFLGTLKSDQREIIILRIWEDLSYQEISEITGKTLDNCKKIVSRGLKNIQANFILLLFIILLF